jgi:hypothetical protein
MSGSTRNHATHNRVDALHKFRKLIISYNRNEPQ